MGIEGPKPAMAIDVEQYRKLPQRVRWQFDEWMTSHPDMKAARARELTVIDETHVRCLCGDGEERDFEVTTAPPILAFKRASWA